MDEEAREETTESRKNIKGDQATGQHMIEEMDQSKGRPQEDTEEHHSKDFSQIEQVDLSEEDKKQEELAKKMVKEFTEQNK